MSGKYGLAVKLSESFKERLEKRWDNTMVVKMLGRTVGCRTLCGRLHTLWKPSRPMKVVDLEEDFFLVRLDCEEDYYRALTRVLGLSSAMHSLCSRGIPHFGLQMAVSQAVIWACFADFPPFWVAVEVDLTKPLRGSVEFDDRDFKRRSDLGSQGAATASQEKAGTSTTSGVGSWMNAPRQGRRRRANVTVSEPQVEVSGSCFNVFNSPAFQEAEQQEVIEVSAPVSSVAVVSSPPRQAIGKRARSQGASTGSGAAQGSPRGVRPQQLHLPCLWLLPIVDVISEATNTIPESFVSPPPTLVVQPTILERQPSPHTRPPDLNVISRTKTLDKEKKKTPVVLPLRKPPVTVSASRKLSLGGDGVPETRILCWNVCGIANAATQATVRDYACMNKVSVAVLVEPRISGATAAMVGPSFTWLRGLVWEWLDRALGNQLWLQSFPSSQASDSLVPDALASLSTELAVWNVEVFGNIVRRKWVLMKRLAGIQRYLSLRPSPFLSSLAENLMVRRRHNYVVALRDEDGRWCTDQQKLQRLAVWFYSKLFFETDLAPPSFPLSGLFPRLAEEVAERPPFNPIASIQAYCWDILHSLSLYHPISSASPPHPLSVWQGDSVYSLGVVGEYLCMRDSPQWKTGSECDFIPRTFKNGRHVMLQFAQGEIHVLLWNNIKCNNNLDKSDDEAGKYSKNIEMYACVHREAIAYTETLNSPYAS
ncbi:hypothetical protein Tsubulata_039682 [Turnera subulata]|uniref:DUF4283 domain-containing protein n=1 Tax=Turnera subulata TaxID=218843 RepID=A0A9Q0JB62_9ROSI|nr:hypothetical protein Tsubulata_039682 [Turnera subulata]